MYDFSGKIITPSHEMYTKLIKKTAQKNGACFFFEVFGNIFSDSPSARLSLSFSQRE